MRVASDPIWAAAAEGTQNVSAALSVLRPVLSEAPMTANVNRSPWSWVAVAAIAACIGVFAIMGTMTATRSPLDIHRTFLTQEFIYDAKTDSQQAAGTTVNGFPTLSEANLSLVLTAIDGPLESAHYVGQNACRLTVVRGVSLAPPSNNDAQIADWTVEGVYFRAIATGMDHAKFEAVAAYLEQATRDAVKPETVLALNVVVSSAASCV
jgi:hypothetical protein